MSVRFQTGQKIVVTDLYRGLENVECEVVGSWVCIDCPNHEPHRVYSVKAPDRTHNYDEKELEGVVK